ncbi:MAG: type II secretion system major pseudopilin GspG [Pseudomonadales bacterium]|nr:type II secretion system major pseudopilin GspG [Pseudomonadales bacterium]
MKNLSRTFSRQKGFTLIEIMVVVIIIGVLAALIAPNIIGKAGEARVTAAKADLKTITSALNMYKLDNFTYPTTDQGLQALVTKPSGQPEPKNYNKDGYLPEFPKDPWGNDYIYISPGTSGGFDLMSYGADGREGGQDDNADIHN